MLNGTLMLLRIGTQIITGETANSLNLTTDLIETTHKHTAGMAKTYMVGERGATISGTGLADPGDVVNWGFSTAFTAWRAGTVLNFRIGRTGTGQRVYDGTALISSLSLDNSKASPSTYSVELQVTGDVTETILP